MKLGALFIDLQDKEITPEEQEILQHPLVGGVIFFSRHFESRQQIKTLTNQIRAIAKKPLLLMTDQEGGRVQRFKNDFTLIPPMASLGIKYDENPSLAEQESQANGYLLASELLAAGVDLSLGPVLDLNKSMSSVIGDRAFHAKPKVVTRLAQAFINGMKKAGMAAVGKHFPGHGSITADTHTQMGSDFRHLQAIQQEDILPFQALIQSGLPAIMAAHVVFPAIDPLPVGYSSYWLRDILCQQLAFKGAILSDDLNMEGANISSSYADRVQAVLEAGCDFALLCNNRPGVIDALDQLNANKYQVNEEKWAPLLGKTLNK